MPVHLSCVVHYFTLFILLIGHSCCTLFINTLLQILFNIMLSCTYQYLICAFVYILQCITRIFEVGSAQMYKHHDPRGFTTLTSLGHPVYYNINKLATLSVVFYHHYSWYTIIRRTRLTRPQLASISSG